MDRRIFGVETEYGVTCTLRGQRRLSPDEVARYLNTSFYRYSVPEKTAVLLPGR